MRRLTRHARLARRAGRIPSPGTHLVARFVACGVLVSGLVACGGDDDGGGDPAAAESSGDRGGTAEPARQDPSAEPTIADGYGLPADYPLPAPAGGTLVSALFDDASGTGNVTIAYPSDMLDGLVQTYDAFFDAVDTETVRVPLTDGLASWQNDTDGYSVVVNGQNQEVQVRLQTGI